MPREADAIVRVHLWIFARDKERLEQFFGTNIGMSKAVRTILHKNLNALEARATKDAQPVQVTDDINLEA